jgi:DNA-binding FadR family transcriptional regulator
VKGNVARLAEPTDTDRTKRRFEVAEPGGRNLQSAIFAPVRSQTAFEETLDRLGNAIKLGLLTPGTRLPAERELCEQLGIARSTLRQALTALVQSGHLVAVRGRGGGTFVADCPPATEHPTAELLASWREACDVRMAVELGVAVLAAERAVPEAVGPLEELVASMDDLMDDFAAYRQADVLFHVGLAEATGSARLVASMTEAQAAMTDLINYIPHPREVLAWSNAQHARLVTCLERHDSATAVRVMAEHLHGTEHVLAGLLPTA